MSYQKPGFRKQYENYIGGKWVPPVDGDYFDDTSPVDGSLIAKVPKSNRCESGKPIGGDE
jgi:aldehyde dehydrogenase